MPPVADRDANSSFGVVRKSYHHHGRGIALMMVLAYAAYRPLSRKYIPRKSAVLHLAGWRSITPFFSECVQIVSKIMDHIRLVLSMDSNTVR